MLRFGSSEALNFVGLWKKLTIWTASSSLNSSTEKWINLNNFSAWNVCSHYLKCLEVCLPSQLFQLLFQLKDQIPNISFTCSQIFWTYGIYVKFSHRSHAACAKNSKPRSRKWSSMCPTISRASSWRCHRDPVRPILGWTWRHGLLDILDLQSMGQIWYTYEWKPQKSTINVKIRFVPWKEWYFLMLFFQKAL